MDTQSAPKCGICLEKEEDDEDEDEEKAHTVTERGRSSPTAPPYYSTISVIPSERFCQVIGTILPDSSDMTAGIRKLYAAAACPYDGQTAKHPRAAGTDRQAKTYSQDDVKFTDEECRSINRYLNDQCTGLDRETFGCLAYPPYDLGRAQAGQANASYSRLDLNDLKWLHDTLARMRVNNASVPYLHSLVTDCSIALPELLPSHDRSFVRPEANRGHRPRKEEKLKQGEKKEMSVKYQRMARSIDSAGNTSPKDVIGFPLKYLDRHLLAVARFACSVGAGFAFGFIGIELLVGPLDFGFRLLLGVMAGLIVALTEIYFLAQKLNEEDDEPSVDQTVPSMATTKLHQD